MSIPAAINLRLPSLLLAPDTPHTSNLLSKISLRSLAQKYWDARDFYHDIWHERVSFYLVVVNFPKEYLFYIFKSIIHLYWFIMYFKKWSRRDVTSRREKNDLLALIKDKSRCWDTLLNITHLYTVSDNWQSVLALDSPSWYPVVRFFINNNNNN